MSLSQEIYTALVTPFTNQNQIDIEAFQRLCLIQFRAGVHGVVVGGTTGESPTLTTEELVSLTETAIKVRGTAKQKVIVGVGTNDTRSTLDRLERVARCGLSRGDLLMVMLPYYNKPNLEGLRMHFEIIAAAAVDKIGLMLYHVPGRTSCKISALELSNLINSINESYPRSIHSVKDATGSMEYSLELRGNLSPKVKLYSGEDGLYLDTVLTNCHPYQGVVSVLSNIKATELIGFIESRKLSDYQNLQRHVEFLFSLSNPIPVKYYLSHKIHLCLDKMRSPLHIGEMTLKSLHEEYEKMTKRLVSGNQIINVTEAESLGNKIWLAKHHQLFEQPDWIRAACSKYSMHPVDTIVTYEEHMRSDKVRFFNRDGGEVEMCANGVRCLSRYNSDRVLYVKNCLLDVKEIDNKISVCISEPTVISTINSFSDKVFLELPLVSDTVKAVQVYTGNPHLVIFVYQEVVPELLERVGKACQTLYRDGINVELVRRDINTLHVQIYERGVGITTSCGSGCVAAAFASNMISKRHVYTIQLTQGEMEIAIDKDGYWTTAPCVIGDSFELV